MSSLPKTYKAAVFVSQNKDLVLQDVELKQPDAGHVLIKVIACGVCHSDLFVKQGVLGDVFPRTTGHEAVGDVVAVGEGVTRWNIGDRVGGAWHGGHDGTCTSCQRGNFQTCDNQVVNGVTVDGGYGEYMTLRAEAAVRIPADANPAEVAPLLCAGVTVFNAMRNMHIMQGGLVAVQGLGGLGHLALQYASKMGYTVVALSSGPDKKDFAMQLGAHHYIDTKAEDTAEALQKMGGANMIVSTAPHAKAVSPLVAGLAPMGKLVALAPLGPVEFDTGLMVIKGLSVHGWPCGHAKDSEDAIAFAHTHGIKCMIEKFPFETEHQKAFEKMESGEVRFRSVLTM
ncbi:chaperonin 10-like protein [Fusarium flagelliforme]|uniref:chaperonin 10-like protein n=1 Tax=Fusarium flagelliforme TaxID=2675880 RepID=UPI001E8D1D9A|nr:chaperonin 10-like protein [Fusarium flagelliforme]KAH7183631.1 chaperonin 10-like protein [Fusarium flagelliforme]